MDDRWEEGKPAATGISFRGSHPYTPDPCEPGCAGFLCSTAYSSQRLATESCAPGLSIACITSMCGSLVTCEYDQTREAASRPTSDSFGRPTQLNQCTSNHRSGQVHQGLPRVGTRGYSDIRFLGIIGQHLNSSFVFGSVAPQVDSYRLGED